MKFKIPKIDTTLLKLGFFNSSALAVKALLGIASTKILALLLGVQGFGVFGVFREFLMLVSNASALGIGNGIIKYTAEKKTAVKQLSSFLSSLMVISLGSSVVFGAILCLYASELSSYLLNSVAYTPLFYVLAILLFFLILFSFLTAIFKGLGLAKNVIIGGIVHALLQLFFFIILVRSWSLHGAIITAIIGLPLTSIYFLWKLPKPYLKQLRFTLALDHAKKLSAYAGMAGFSMIAVPVTSLLIKNAIHDDLGAEALGYWEALNKISHHYTMFGYSLLTLFIIPKLSSDSSYSYYRKMISGFLTTIFPFFVVFLVLIYFFKTPFIRLLLSKDYLAITPWIKWFFLGDIFRILAMLLATYFHANRAWKQYLTSDIVLVVTQYFISITMIGSLGLEGGAIGYCITFGIYLLVTIVLLSSMDFFKNRNTKI